MLVLFNYNPETHTLDRFLHWWLQNRSCRSSVGQLQWSHPRRLR